MYGCKVMMSHFTCCIFIKGRRIIAKLNLLYTCVSNIARNSLEQLDPKFNCHNFLTTLTTRQTNSNNKNTLCLLTRVVVDRRSSCGGLRKVAGQFSLCVGCVIFDLFDSMCHKQQQKQSNDFSSYFFNPLIPRQLLPPSLLPIEFLTF